MSSAHSETSVVALNGSRPSTTRMSVETLGQAGSHDALARLNAAMAELKALAAQPLLNRAVAALMADDFAEGCKWALKALDQDERNGFGWYLLAIARERVGDFATSVKAYESALALIPDQAEIANDLGRLAYRMGMRVQAEKLFRHFLARFPNHFEGANNLACAIRDDGRFEEAIEVLKPAIHEAPEQPILWNTLGTVIGEQGDLATGVVFFEEALRLNPALAKARYNRANAKLALGDVDGALVDVEGAMVDTQDPSEQQMMRFLRSSVMLAKGRIAEGWADYEARLHPSFSDVTLFAIDRPQWSPGQDIAGKHLLVIGEQGLGDEVLFANLLSDVARDLGPDGKLSIAIERRLVPLFSRAFPQADVTAHATGGYEGHSVRLAPEVDAAEIDLWTPMGSLLRGYRTDLSTYPDRAGYLVADPERVAYWRAELAKAPVGRKIGLLWKSAVSSNARHRFFAPFERWAPVLKTPGVTFVNLQYGDCATEIAWAAKELGVEIWTPPGIDLKQDLDDVAALTCALDLTVGFANATVNLAGACGANAWLISTPGAWPRLGLDRYPWYPQVRLFTAQAYGEWDPVMDQIAVALQER
jgi:tetratricopeptide (TPR) repeat protein